MNHFYVSQKLLILCVPLLCTSWQARAEDCSADFEKDNRFKPEAGAFRMMDTAQVFMEANGKWGHARTDRAVSEIAPPGALHFSNSAPLNTAEVVVVNGKGWKKDAKNGSWEAMSSETIKDILQSAFKFYFSSEGMSELTCSEQQTLEGTPLRVYKYRLPPDNIGIKEVMVTAAFDKNKRLPVSSTLQRRGNGLDIQTTTLVTFTPNIRILPPVASEKKLSRTKAP